VDAQSGKTAAQAYSGENGEYTIDFVRTGAYTVRYTLSDGMIFTREGESAVSGVDSAEGETKRFELAMGEGLAQLNVGAIVPALVEGRLYTDSNEDGLYDPQESGLSGAVVTLMQGGTVVANCETDASGKYVFDTVRPGAYRVRVALPEETLFALDAPLTLENPDALEGETTTLELDMGEWMTLDAIGTVEAASIHGAAWSDDDADGRMDGQEPMLRGTQAELLALNEYGEETLLASAVVDTNGAYAFDLLRSGAYRIRFTLPEGRLFAVVEYSALRVAGSALPVASMPLAVWNSLTAASV